jgi:hypothetical protein
MRVGHVFIVVGAIVVATLVGIIASFAVVSEQSVDRAFVDGVRAEIGLVRNGVLIAGARVKVAAKVLRNYSLATGRDCLSLPIGAHPPPGSAVTSLANFSTLLELTVHVLAAEPTFSYAYCMARYSNPEAWRPPAGNPIDQFYWEFSGAGVGADGVPFVLVSDRISNVSTFSSAMPLDFVSTSSYNATPAQADLRPWILNTVNTPTSSANTGRWFTVAQFPKPGSAEVDSLITFSVPMTWDAVTGQCTQAFNVDVNIAQCAQGAAQGAPAAAARDRRRRARRQAHVLGARAGAGAEGSGRARQAYRAYEPSGGGRGRARSAEPADAARRACAGDACRTSGRRRRGVARARRVASQVQARALQGAKGRAFSRSVGVRRAPAAARRGCALFSRCGAPAATHSACPRGASSRAPRSGARAVKLAPRTPRCWARWCRARASSRR